MADDLKIPMEELLEDFAAGKLDEAYGEWFLRTRTGTQALETLQQATGEALFLETTIVMGGVFSIGLTVSEIGKAMRPNVRERRAFLAAYQAEEHEHVLARKERMEDDPAGEQRPDCGTCHHPRGKGLTCARCHDDPRPYALWEPRRVGVTYAN